MTIVLATPRRRGLAAVLLAALAAGVAAPPRPAAAAEPWEREIPAAAAEQDAEFQIRDPKRVVTVAEQRASRDAGLLARYLLARAYAHPKVRRDADAIVVYGEAIGLAPTCWFAHRDRGFVHYRLAMEAGKGDPVRGAQARPADMAAAERDLQRAIDLKPAYPDALRMLVEVKRGLKKNDAVVPLLGRLLDLQPADDTARFQLAEAHFQAGRHDEALRLVEALLAKDPQSTGLHHLKARILAGKGDPKAAMAIFRGLADRNSEARPPLNEYLPLAVAAKDREAVLWCLERLRRLARSDEERLRITGEIERLRAQAPASAPATQGAPTVEKVRALLAHEDPAARQAALEWLYRGSVAAMRDKTPPPADLPTLQAVVARLPDVSATNRILALRVLSLYGQNFAAIVRLRLRPDEEADPTVRLHVVDTLRDLANPASVLALAPHAADEKDPTLATAARSALYEIARVPPPDVAEDSRLQAEAFRAWWASPAARDVKLTAVERVFESRDRFAEDLLYPMLKDGDPAVWAKAYLVLRSIAQQTTGRNVHADWVRSFPALPDRALAPDGRAEFDAAIEAWWKRRPA